jgi:ABC-2 type transport system ATP-binding protein
VVYEGSLPELIATTAGRYEMRTTDDDRAAEIARHEPGVERIVRRGHAGLTLIASEETAARLSISLGEAGVGISALVPRTATLEELFFRMTEDQPVQDPPVPDPVGERA